jgi:hypothetical protein
MENIGNRNNEALSAILCINENAYLVEDGIRAFRDIHNATNKIASHGEGKLADVIESSDALRTYVLATIVELAEFVQTLPWKPWRTSVKVIDDKKVLDEFADILAFIGVLITILNNMGYSPDQITDAYILKEHININRFIENNEEKENDVKV